MKVFLILLVVAGGVFLLVKSGTFSTYYSGSDGVVHTHCWGSDCPPQESSGPVSNPSVSPAVADVLAVNAAEESTNADEAVGRVSAFLNAVPNARSGPGAALVRQKFPSWASTIASERHISREHVLAVDLQTAVSQQLPRGATSQPRKAPVGLSNTQRNELAAHLPTAKVIDHLVTGTKATHSGLTRDLQPCRTGLRPRNARRWGCDPTYTRGLIQQIR